MGLQACCAYFSVTGTVLVVSLGECCFVFVCDPYCFTCVRLGGESWGSDGEGDCLRVCLCANLKLFTLY